MCSTEFWKMKAEWALCILANVQCTCWIVFSAARLSTTTWIMEAWNFKMKQCRPWSTSQLKKQLFEGKKTPLIKNKKTAPRLSKRKTSNRKRRSRKMSKLNRRLCQTCFSPPTLRNSNSQNCLPLIRCQEVSTSWLLLLACPWPRLRSSMKSKKSRTSASTTNYPSSNASNAWIMCSKKLVC